ncbi:MULTISPECIES: cytochrome P450 [unclassified Streptomyces]|uniref:Cytochrome P450 n=1 Tax=Streptomyces sp. NBC_00119 TaxID=2975659 RepID=A0AAU1U6D2_9ACTN|nr:MULTISPECIES: cytochrome P450 [unclassified Streptomyces]MCX4642226.1 cytochrome P450 [Streptomyces sp. NBC_01446]MCX5327170.1 cytochrome P450 [Streptomyces sp. NBC_00120]
MGEAIDLGDYAGFTADPYPVYEELRARGPVHRVLLPKPADDGEAWLIVGHEEARAALTDPRLVKSPAKLGFSGLDEELIGTHLLITDPPHHARLRSLVTRAFTARRVESLRPRIQRVTDDLLDAMLPHGRADLVESFAFPLPLTVICELLGVPDIDRADFRRMSNEVVAPSDRDGEYATFVELAAYLRDLIEDKRASAPADDLLSALIRTTAEDGDRLSPDELCAMAFLLLIAGHETTVNLIASGVRALLTHPDQLAALRADMTLLGGAVEEMLRYEGPVENATYRFTVEDTEVGGTVIPGGSAVLVGLASADHDPERFHEPGRFDIRRDARGHIAFGHGLHHCLGAPLARLEGQIALRSLLDRAPALALDGPADDWLPGMLIRGVRSLPVRW